MKKKPTLPPDPAPRPDLRARIQDQGLRPDAFTGSCSFLCTLLAYKGDTKNGNLDVTFTVGPGEKNAALPVTDTAGELLLVTVSRVRYDGTV